MKPNNWQNIETVFHQALDLTDAAEREKYLTDACAGDSMLRREIESLLSSFEKRVDFLEQPAFDLGMKVLENTVEIDLTGQVIGSYKIIEKLGSGGMGDVYLAEDGKLNRKVALKFISTALGDNNWAKRQLVKEAQAVAMLDHPNICPIYGIEEIGEHTFIVMQYIQGETLSSLIRQRSQSKTDDAERFEVNLLAMSEQITSAIAAAHEHGIIHRDVKSGNIMITPGGQVKVLDFGLAKIIKQSDNAGESLSLISQKGLIVGTVAYMSPEQLRGENLDFRSDIFSLGTVFYELAASKHPFLENSNAETISAILTRQPAQITTLQNGNSADFNRMIKKCLEKNKEARYQSAVELVLEIQSLQKRKPSKIKRINRLSLLIASLILVVLVILGSAVYQRATKPRTLAILPFVNLTANSNYDYMTGMADTLFNKLSASSQLNIKPLTQTSDYSPDGVDPVKLGKTLDVEAILTGRIVDLDDQSFIEIKLLSTFDGGELLSEKVPLAGSDPLNLQNNISEQVIFKLQSPLSTNHKKSQSLAQKEDPQAYTYYLKGLNYWKNRGSATDDNLKNARDAFYEAIKIDPNYARAYTGLAYVFIVRPSVNFKAMHPQDAKILARTNAEKAIAIDPNLCEAHAALGAILFKYEYKWSEAEKEFKRAMDLNPDIAQTYFWYSELLVATGRKEALEVSRKALELDPSKPLAYLNVGRILYFERRFDEAEKQLTEALDKFPKYVPLKNMLGIVYLQQQKSAAAIQIFEELHAGNKAYTAMLGYAYGKTGNRAQALKMLDELDEMEKKDDYLPAHEKVLVYIGLGEKDKALSGLQKAYEEAFFGLTSLNIDPLYDDLRSDERFQSLIEQMQLNQPF